MHRLRAFGAALVATCAVASAVSASASASALCYEEVAKCPAVQRVPITKLIVGHNNGNVVVKASSGIEMICTTSEFEDEVTSNPGGAAKVKDRVVKLVYGGCTETAGHTKCKIKNVPEPPLWESLLTWTKNGAGPNGTFELKSVEFKVECSEIPITCVYQGLVAAEKKLTGELWNKGTKAHSEVILNNSELVSSTGGAFCGVANAKIKAAYTITDNSGPTKEIYLSEE
jgi:hypothetical protein